MFKTLLMSATLLGLVAGPAFAQNSNQSTQTPPSPNANSAAPEPTNSLPRGAGTGTFSRPGNNVGTTRTSPQPMARAPMGSAGMAAMPAAGEPTDTGMTGMRPMRGQGRHAAMHGTAGAPHGRMARGPARPARSDDTAGIDAPRSGDYRGGAGSPLSNTASNTTAANTRSEIAPRLPDPAAGSNTPQAYLQAAQRALASGRTGAAQEALERAETRILSRSIDPSMAASPADMPMVMQISNARRALAGRDTSGARTAIDAALAGS